MHDPPWEVTADGGFSTEPDRDEIRRALEILVASDSMHELRSLPSGRCALIRGDDLDGAVEVAVGLADERGLYYTLNPLQWAPKKAATNADVLARRWFLVDVDPVKGDPDNSSTDEEKGHARAVAQSVLDDLLRRGWPAPLLIDSGNGFHLVYRVDAPNDTDSRKLFSSALKAIAKAHDTPEATVDVKVHNAARISKLPGTWARKGTHSDERPHRPCRLLNVPSAIEAVPVPLIRALIESESPPAATPPAESPWIVRATDGGQGAYVRAAVDAELARVALSPVGDRNNSLNVAAFALGTLLSAGALDRDEIADRLAFAATRAGLPEAEARTTIQSGLDAGSASPRKLPERDARPRGNVSAVADPARPEVITDADVITVCLDDVIPVPIDWLMPKQIPLGKLTLLAGLAKQGKSFLTMDLAARVSTGSEVPGRGDGQCFPIGSVVLLSAEDDLDDTIKPRLIAAGADCSKIHALTTIRFADGSFGPFDLSYVPHLERAVIRQGDTKLVIIDPITQYVGGRVDDHKVTQLRALLGPLRDLAARLHVAILIVTHFKKGAGTNALHQVIGSSAYTALARANWILTRDPDDPKRRLFLDAGTNIAEDPPGLAFRIIDGRLEWEALPISLTANDALQHEQENQQADRRKESPTKVEAAITWLATLFETTLRIPSEDVVRQGDAKGFSRDTLFKAKKEMPWIKAEKSRDHNGAWVWYRDLPMVM